jgi:hypothetical protein
VGYPILQAKEQVSLGASARSHHQDRGNVRPQNYVVVVREQPLSAGLDSVEQALLLEREVLRTGSRAD